MRARRRLGSGVVEVGCRWRADTAENRTSADQKCAHDWTNRAGQGVHDDRARYQEPNDRAEHRRPILGSDDPTPPESDSCDEQRGEESTENSARPKPCFAERMSGYRSEQAASTTDHAGKKEESNALHMPRVRRNST